MTKFKKGQSGNPSGRPKQESARIREQLNQHSDEIVEILLNKVRDGDTVALKMALDRISPALKATSPNVEINTGKNTLAMQAKSVFFAASTGEIAPDTAVNLISALGGVAKIIETSELESRVTALEEIKTNEH
jgi:hypothetical protein